MKIADVHAHIFPDALAEKATAAIGEFYRISMHHPAALSTLLELETQAGIGCCVVSSSATSAAQVGHIHDFISASCKAHTNLLGFGTLFPGMPDWQQELERLPQLGMRGIKVHSDFQKMPIDAPEAVDMYRAVAKMGLPVLFHMGDDRYDYSSPRRLYNLVRQVPDLTVIAAHFGGYRVWEEALALSMPENVYYDTSSSLMFLSKERALEFLDKLGAERFLFGTDFPMWSPGEELERFLALGLPEDLRDRILYQNFETLFGVRVSEEVDYYGTI